MRLGFTDARPGRRPRWRRACCRNRAAESIREGPALDSNPIPRTSRTEPLRPVPAPPEPRPRPVARRSSASPCDSSLSSRHLSYTRTGPCVLEQTRRGTESRGPGAGGSVSRALGQTGTGNAAGSPRPAASSAASRIVQASGIDPPAAVLKYGGLQPKTRPRGCPATSFSRSSCCESVCRRLEESPGLAGGFERSRGAGGSPLAVPRRRHGKAPRSTLGEGAVGVPAAMISC